MAHQFKMIKTIEGISLQTFKQLASDVSLHENVCRRIPGQNIQILRSEKQGNIYTLERSYHLDVHIPDLAKKFLKDAFCLKRKDVSDLEAMRSVVELGANLPLEAHCERQVTGDDEQICFELHWTVRVKVPLVSGLLERHAEGEIRKFSEIEIAIVEDELRRHCAVY